MAFARFLLLCCLVPLAWGQSHYPLAQRISSDNGLSQNVVLELAEDGYGRLWVATQDGLNLLNNNEFLVFRADQKKYPLSGTLVTDLAVAGDTLWAATDAGIDSIDITTLESRSIALPQQGKPVTHLAFLADSLFFLMDRRLFRYRPASGLAEPMPVPEGFGRVLNIGRYDDERLLLLGEDRLGLIGAEDGQWQPLALPLPKRAIKAVAVAAGQIWFSVRDQGLFACRAESGACRRYDKASGSLASNNIAHIHHSDGTLYLATDNGIGLLDLDSDKLDWLYPHSRHNAYQASQIARRVLVSRDGEIHIGSHNGLYRVPASYAKVQAFNVGAGGFPDTMIDLDTIRLDGRDRLAVLEPGLLSLWTLDDGRLQAFSSFAYPPELEPTELLVDGDSLYLATLTRGTFMLDPESGQIRPLDERFPGLGTGHLFNMDSPAADIRIFHLENAMKVYGLRQGQWQPLWQHSFATFSARASYWQGRLYVALYHLGLMSAPMTTDWQPPGDWVQHQGLGIALNLYEQQDRLYVLTANRGLFQIQDGQPHGITRVPASDDLNSQTLLCALGDDQGRLLLSSHKGLAILDPAQQHQASLTGLQGVHEQEFSQYRCGTLEGMPYFAGEGGLTLLHDSALESQRPPAPVWSYMEADGQVHQPSEQGILELVSPGLVRLHFVAAPSQLPMQAGYSYRIRSLSAQWTELKSSAITLVNLRPGRYQVELRMQDFAGNRAPLAQASLVIRPTFWESPLAIAGYVLLALLVIGALVSGKLRTNQARLALAMEKNRRQQDYARRLEAEVRARTDELELKKEEAVNANKAKTRFIAAASHDLKHPINLIRLQLHQENNAELDQRLGANLDFLEQLVASIVELSKLDAKVLVPQEETLRLDHFLRQLAADFGDFARHRGLELAVSLPEGLWIRSDGLLLRRILGNILDNAIKISEPDSRVSLEAACQGEGVKVSIRDQGPGMSEDELAGLFTPFRRGTSKYQGSGLGLSVVKGMSDLLGLDLEVSSQPGLGTCFSLILPRAVEPAPAGTAKALVLALVEDDPEQRRQLAARLGGKGLEVRCYAHAEALLGEDASCVDAVLSDVDLGTESDGFSYLADYQRLLGGRGPVIYMSGNPQARHRMPKGSGLFFLSKPLKLGKLMWILHQGEKQ
ncbi:hybrid sensor histidine kinase/response regulator [Gallaecimonas sp. GXIMD4217]|uniref:hybrid sensor histidine kinase/response regulator n=1 Tax=Gallaecimonas sp. GXIMD4217 TaxID=3131927 RepID=UPI00311AFA37